MSLREVQRAKSEKILNDALIGGKPTVFPPGRRLPWYRPDQS